MKCAQRVTLWFALSIALNIVSVSSATLLDTSFTYQGQLRDGGNPANGTYDMEFALFDLLNAGVQQGSTVCKNNIAIVNGLFTVTLDFGAQFVGDKRYLEIKVREDTGLVCGNAAGFVILGPRAALTAAPYALDALGIRLPLAQSVTTASDAINITNAGTGDCAQFNITNPANVGEAVEGRTDGSGDAFQGVTTGTGHAGYFQISNAANAGDAVMATTNGTGGRAVSGTATAAAGAGSGVYGSSGSSSGFGVYGENADNVGVRGSATATSGVNYGVQGVSPSTSGRGVYGSASATTGTTYGGYFTNSSVNGTGVYGVSTSGVVGYGIGVHGVSYSDDEDLENGGVVGESFGISGEGVVGRCNTVGGNNWTVGVWGISTNNLAGLFTGDVSVQGHLSKSSGSFKIDHPLDPANKYLLHSFVESPDMMNIYNGNVVTDADGMAEVRLPDYFETLNRDFRYQLTGIGQFAQAIVAEEINGNRFAIRTDKPGVKVSWQVTGVRQDPWAEAHRIEVEPTKPGHARGKYLNPELYGQADELGETSVVSHI